ncbi:hypothetical protein BBJ28_00014706 [Nothophytophthora sp. Chile5]|nr:hypothetical protein BBJ28_00014706 [Nothophytophthora sp. Chile5]
MSSTGERMDALLAVWEDATAPLDAKVRADPLIFAPASEITSKSRWQRRLATEFSVDDALQRKLLQEVHVHGTEEGQLDSNAFAAKLMALCCPSGNTAVASKALTNMAFLIVGGWQFDVKDGDQRQVLWCESCNRRWRLFHEAIDTSKAEVSEPPTKRVKMEPHAVDCLAQHRQFCPWVTGRQSSLDEDQPKGETDQYGENDAKLWGFMKLPEWQQYAQALQFLDEPVERAIVLTGANETTQRRSNPEQALESVRAVLEL